MRSVTLWVVWKWKTRVRKHRIKKTNNEKDSVSRLWGSLRLGFKGLAWNALHTIHRYGSFVTTRPLQWHASPARIEFGLLRFRVDELSRGYRTDTIRGAGARLMEQVSPLSPREGSCTDYSLSLFHYSFIPFSMLPGPDFPFSTHIGFALSYLGQIGRNYCTP